MNWDDRTTVQKGNLGEAILDQWLDDQGYIAYRPVTDCAHPFDRLCASRDKKTVFVADAKAKPARKHYPDTGIDERHYRDYLHIQEKYRMDVFLSFIDEDRGQMYGNFLRRLDMPRRVQGNDYPWVHHEIRYFPLKAMIVLADLSATDVARLSNLSTRNPVYRGAA